MKFGDGNSGRSKIENEVKKGGFCTRGKEARVLHGPQKHRQDWGGIEREWKGGREQKRRKERSERTKEEEGKERETICFYIAEETARTFKRQNTQKISFV